MSTGVLYGSEEMKTAFDNAGIAANWRVIAEPAEGGFIGKKFYPGFYGEMRKRTERFSEDAIDRLLTKIAFEISKAKGFKGLLKFEADTEWNEEIPSWKAGARLTYNGVTHPEFDPRTDAQRLHRYVQEAAQLGGREGIARLRPLASFQVKLRKEDL